MGSNRLARQSFGMVKFYKDCILFEFCLWKKKRKIEDEKNRNSCLIFSNLLKVSGNFGVDITLSIIKEK